MASNVNVGAASNLPPKKLLRQEGVEKGVVGGDVMNAGQQAACCVKNGRLVFAIADAHLFLSHYCPFVLHTTLYSSSTRPTYNLVLICICLAGCNRVFNVVASGQWGADSLNAALCDKKTETAIFRCCIQYCTPGLNHPLDPTVVSVCVCVCMHASYSCGCTLSSHSERPRVVCENGCV